MSERSRPGPARGSRSLRPTAAKTAVAIPDDPVGRLGLPLAMSGLRSVGPLRRSSRRLGIETVRDLLFHLPRRYDDLRELQVLGNLHLVPDGTVVSARVRVDGPPGPADVASQGPGHHGLPRGRDRHRRGHLVRAPLHRATPPRGRRDRGLGQAQARGFTPVIEGPDFQPAGAVSLLHAGRIVPVYRLTAGLTAARLRAAMREALDRDGSAYPEYLPPRLRRETGVPPIARGAGSGPLPARLRGARRRPPPPRLRRAAGPPGGHGDAPAVARARARRPDRGRRRPGPR